MPPRDYESAPVSDRLGLADIINGLVADLDDLRAGKISVNDAIARSMLAKQIFNGVRIYLNGTKLLSDHAKQVPAVSSSKEKTISWAAHHPPPSPSALPSSGL